MADGEEVPTTGAADSDELEPLFDYSRVRPTFDFRFDDSDLEKSDIFVHCNKRGKLADAVSDDADAVDGDTSNEKGDAGVKKSAVVCLDEEDWLAPPPLKPVARSGVCKDKTLHGPRLEKQDVAKLAEDTYQKVFETVKKDLAAKKPPESIDLELEGEDMIEVRHKPAEHVIPHKPTRTHMKRAREKILITIQDKAGKLPFRVYKDEKFDKLFSAYAKKVQLSPSDLTFVFDGEKVNSASTPQDLDLEDYDMIEVRRKSS